MFATGGGRWSMEGSCPKPCLLLLCRAAVIQPAGRLRKGSVDSVYQYYIFSYIYIYIYIAFAIDAGGIQCSQRSIMTM